MSFYPSKKGPLAKIDLSMVKYILTQLQNTTNEVILNNLTYPRKKSKIHRKPLNLSV
jgi:hypothetical protein